MKRKMRKVRRLENLGKLWSSTSNGITRRNGIWICQKCEETR
jgi:hypothetical protein